MTGYTSSSDFVSISASGPDWRSVSRQCVEALETVRSSGRPFTIGFIYVSEELAEDVDSILTLLRGVTGVNDWFGCTSLGVFSHEGTHLGLPSLSLMLGVMNKDGFAPLAQVPETWMESMPLGLLHAPPDDGLLAAALDQGKRAYLVGGVSSARSKNHIIAPDIAAGSPGGVLFAPGSGCHVALMRGWMPLHDGVSVTGIEDNVITTLDGRPALTVMREVMDQAVADGLMPGEGGDDVEGSMHVSFPVSGADQDDEMIRNIITADEENGTITLAHVARKGERMKFVYRNRDIAGADMRTRLQDLKQRLHGHEITGMVYISCIARIDMLDTDADEVKALRDQLGGLPLTGFYAVGEIARTSLRGYSGVLLAFTKEEER